MIARGLSLLDPLMRITSRGTLRRSHARMLANYTHRLKPCPRCGQLIDRGMLWRHEGSARCVALAKKREGKP